MAECIAAATRTPLGIFARSESARADSGLAPREVRCGRDADAFRDLRAIGSRERILTCAYESRHDLSGLVPGTARGVRRNRARGRAPRGRARRRRPRRHALRVGRLADPRAPRVGLPDRAERVDRSHVLGDAAHRARHPPHRRVRRRARPHGPARARLRGASGRALLPHRARAARGTSGPDVRGGRVPCPRGEADLHLDEPAEAEARALPGSRTARTRSTSPSTRSGASPAASISSSSGA